MNFNTFISDQMATHFFGPPFPCSLWLLFSPLTPTVVAASLGAFFFLLLFTLTEAPKVFSHPREGATAILLFSPVRSHGGSNEVTITRTRSYLFHKDSATSTDETRISPPSRYRSPRAWGAPRRSTLDFEHSSGSFL